LGGGWPGEVLVTAERARLASPLNRGQAQVRTAVGSISSAIRAVCNVLMIYAEQTLISG